MNNAQRSRDWNQGLAEDLQDHDFAREFLSAALEDGISLDEALGKVHRAIGGKEFAEIVAAPAHGTAEKQREDATPSAAITAPQR